MALKNLQREGVETFFPKLRRKRTIRRVRKWTTSPLFPSYFFARFDPEVSARLVKFASGVINIVSFGGRPAVVDEAIVDTIKSHALDEVVTVQPVELRPGEMIEIRSGPLRGLQGIFERAMSDRERVIVLLNSIAKGARVEVAREEIERAG